MDPVLEGVSEDLLVSVGTIMSCDLVLQRGDSYRTWIWERDLFRHFQSMWEPSLILFVVLGRLL